MSPVRSIRGNDESLKKIIINMLNYDAFALSK